MEIIMKRATFNRKYLSLCISEIISHFGVCLILNLGV